MLFQLINTCYFKVNASILNKYFTFYGYVSILSFCLNSESYILKFAFCIRFKQAVDFKLNVSRLIGLGCFSDPVQFQQYFLLLIKLLSFSNLREIYNELAQGCQVNCCLHFRSWIFL
jgi:hypothetical protein